MPRIQYIEKRFHASSLRIIDTANAIIAEYAQQGFSLTLRQLYYQFVARDILPNRQQSYDRLGKIISDARLAGLIDWRAIVDRTRALKGNTHWGSPSDIISGAARGYRLDSWATQDFRVEVWIEKDALVGVIERTCVDLDIDFFSCRGYTSQSALWEAGQRLAGYEQEGQTPVILHLGDHDPSGIDMTRDIQDRLDLFCGDDVVQVERIALTMDQVREYSPPPNPAKLTDSRAGDYIAQYGRSSWELDALEPKVLDALIRDNVKGYMNTRKRNAIIREQEHDRAHLNGAADNWGDVVSFLDENEED